MSELDEIINAIVVKSESMKDQVWFDIGESTYLFSKNEEDPEAELRPVISAESTDIASYLGLTYPKMVMKIIKAYLELKARHDEKQAFRVLIQLQPDKATQETFTIGVLIYCPGKGTVIKADTRLQRVARILNFTEEQHQYYKALVKTTIKKISDDTFYNLSYLENYQATEDNSITFSKPIPINLDAGIDESLDRYYKMLVKEDYTSSPETECQYEEQKDGTFNSSCGYWQTRSATYNDKECPFCHKRIFRSDTPL